MDCKGVISVIYNTHTKKYLSLIKGEKIVFFKPRGPVYTCHENDKFAKRLGQEDARNSGFQVTSFVNTVNIHF